MNCPDEPHIHLTDGTIALVPLEIAESNQMAYSSGQRMGFLAGLLVGVLLAAAALVLGLLAGSL